MRSSDLYKEDLDYIANFELDWDKLSHSSVLILGATGLIGTVLVDAIIYKNKLSNTNIKVIPAARKLDKLTAHFESYIDDMLLTPIECDVTKPIKISEKIDYIINLASNTHPVLYATQPIGTIDTIIEGARNVLNLAAEQGVKRVINTSSVEVYGENRGDIERFTEGYCGYIDCNTLRAGYTEGKRLAETIGQAYIEERGVDVVSARLGRVYGATTANTDTKSTTQFINNAVNNEDIVLKSEGKQRFSYVYVADVATAFLLLLTRGDKGAAYNVASDEVKTFYEVAEILAGINDRKVVFDLPDDAINKGGSKVQIALMDSSKMKQLGWASGYTINDGLTRTVKIVRSENAK